MRYEIPFVWFGDSAKNVGIIPDRAQSDAYWVVLDAADDAEAYNAIVKLYSATDHKRRPVSGRTYVRHWRAADVHLNDGRAPLEKLPRFKKGDRIILHKPHAVGHSANEKGYRLGTIDEVLSETHYGIALDNYPNIADFHIREFATQRS